MVNKLLVEAWNAVWKLLLETGKGWPVLCSDRTIGKNISGDNSEDGKCT